MPVKGRFTDVKDGVSQAEDQRNKGRGYSSGSAGNPAFTSEDDQKRDELEDDPADNDKIYRPVGIAAVPAVSQYSAGKCKDLLMQIVGQNDAYHDERGKEQQLHLPGYDVIFRSSHTFCGADRQRRNEEHREVEAVPAVPNDGIHAVKKKIFAGSYAQPEDQKPGDRQQTAPGRFLKDAPADGNRPREGHADVDQTADQGRRERYESRCAERKLPDKHGESDKESRGSKTAEVPAIQFFHKASPSFRSIVSELSGLSDGCIKMLDRSFKRRRVKTCCGR